MHVKFMSYKIDKVITEELLRNLFSIYGEVCDTTIKQVSIDRVSRLQQNMAFFFFFTLYLTLLSLQLLFSNVEIAPTQGLRVCELLQRRGRIHGCPARPH